MKRVLAKESSKSKVHRYKNLIPFQHSSDWMIDWNINDDEKCRIDRGDYGNPITNRVHQNLEPQANAFNVTISTGLRNNTPMNRTWIHHLPSKTCH